MQDSKYCIAFNGRGSKMLISEIRDFVSLSFHGIFRVKQANSKHTAFLQLNKTFGSISVVVMDFM